MFGKKIQWFIKDMNGKPVAVHESDGTGTVNINLDGIEFPNKIAMEIYKEEKIAKRKTQASFGRLARQEAASQIRIKKDGFGGGKNNDVDGTDVSGWWS